MVYGGLLLGGVGVFALLGMIGIVAFGGEGAAIYWLVVLPFVFFFGAWLLLVMWCFVDAERLGMNGPLWALLVFLLGFPVGPLVYLVLRQERPHRPGPEGADGILGEE